MNLNDEIKKAPLLLTNVCSIGANWVSKGFTLGTHCYWLCQYHSVLLSCLKDSL